MSKKVTTSKKRVTVLTHSQYTKDLTLKPQQQSTEMNNSLSCKASPQRGNSPRRSSESSELREVLDKLSNCMPASAEVYKH